MANGYIKLIGPGRLVQFLVTHDIPFRCYFDEFELVKEMLIEVKYKDRTWICTNKDFAAITTIYQEVKTLYYEQKGGDN